MSPANGSMASNRVVMFSATMEEYYVWEHEDEMRCGHHMLAHGGVRHICQ